MGSVSGSVTGICVLDNKKRILHQRSSYTATTVEVSPAYKVLDKKIEERISTLLQAAEKANEFPSEIVIDDTKDLLYVLNKYGVSPKFMNPSPEGGIILEFENKSGYFIFDYDNQGEIGFLKRDKDGKRWSYDLKRENYIGFITKYIIG